MTTDDIHKCYAVLLYRAVCLRIDFKRIVEKKWKMITVWHSVEGQASCTDERYLLIINFLCTTWPKVIGGGEFKPKADFNVLIIIIF